MGNQSGRQRGACPLSTLTNLTALNLNKTRCALAGHTNVATSPLFATLALHAARQTPPVRTTCFERHPTQGGFSPHVQFT